MKQIIEVTDNNFKKEVLESKVPVVIDFWAVWCGPCKAMSPILNELAKEFAGRAKIGKVNIDENSNTTETYSVFNIPTLIFFKDGIEAGRVVGINPREKISKRIVELL